MKLQKPRGTRDFFPEEMAWRNFLTDTWRNVAIRHGFDQVDGPIYEHLDLYKVKSGDGIISELFSFRRHDGETDYAIRPEFTPTLARMVADRANALPRPIKWFCTPNLCRAEAPQRSRLREFFQWNCDIIGLESSLADAECIFTLVDLCREMGLKPGHVRVKISHRETVRHILSKLGVAEDRMTDAFNLLDRRAKIEEEVFRKQALELDLQEDSVDRFDEICRMKYEIGKLSALREALGGEADLSDLESLDEQLRGFRLEPWCEYDLGIVRGLAYYTGTVFELHETSGMERAMAGGGRYDRLIEMFGGPSLPAVGFGMGDVVLENVLADKGLLPGDVTPRPDVFVIALSDAGQAEVTRQIADLRTAGLHARFSYKTTRKIGKLLNDAERSSAPYVVILDDKIAEGKVGLKHLASGEQREVDVANLVESIRTFEVEEDGE